MKFYEILIIIGVIAFVCIIFGRMIYKKIHNVPTCDCGCHKSGKKLIKEYRKMYPKNK